MTTSLVVKIGGSTLGQHDTTMKDLVALQKDHIQMVVVHGGGKTVSEWLERLGTNTRFVEGLRVTNAKTLGVITAVLAGLVNKEMVAAINQAGGKAIGLTGIDGGLIEATIRNPDLGYVGEIVRVNIEPLMIMLEAGYLPLIAPLALRTPAASDDEQKLLNVNADTIAGEVTAALQAQRLIFLTDVTGIKSESGQVLPHLRVEEAQVLMAKGTISGGMTPKVQACIRAIAAGAKASIGDGRQPHALTGLIQGKGGTTIN